jgi:glycyl-tRNA synthetase beta chain
MKQDLLIEMGTEDLPARYMLPLAKALGLGIAGSLRQRGIECGEARTYATPRRIAVLVADVAPRQPDQRLERKGPQLAAAFRDGAPTPAALGFARSCGVELALLLHEGGQLVYRGVQQGRETIRLIPEIFDETLKQMDQLVPRRMRWGDRTDTFVRPVQWIVAMLGGEAVALERFGHKAGRTTYGHRFHAPQAITLRLPADYAGALMQARVWADFDERSAAIRRQVEALATKLGGSARITEGLLEEVTALVEWPMAISGRIEPRFLELPPEVVVATVETNQRYFTVFDAAGKLLPHFITVANIESAEVAQVIAGNERVIRPRLTDALFFWQQDRSRSLDAFLEALDRMAFAGDLGSLLAKSRRVEALARRIAASLGNEAQSPLTTVACRSAALCKADLASKMVYEFPELQGIMGGYYARAAGESEAVAAAIIEHYRPLQAGGAIPATPAGRIVALADKLDTLTGIFAIGQMPTASKDPYALRRAALGILRICIEGRLDLDLRELVETALGGHSGGKRKESTAADVWDFVVERLHGYCLELGASVEQVEAVRVMGASHPLDFIRRLEALRAFQKLPAAATLAAADKRARNILRQSGNGAADAVQTRLFEGAAEHALLAEIERVDAVLAPLRARAGYVEMLDALAALKEPVDAFFASVMVMVPNVEVRGNRLALLARLDALCREVADLSCLPG